MAIIGTVDIENESMSGNHYQHLESRCTEWLIKATPNKRWMNLDDYCAALKTEGHEADVDI